MKNCSRLVLYALALAVFVASENSFSLDLKPSEIRGKKRRKPVSVLQNRFFKKKWRPEVGFVMGSLLNEAYTDTSTTGVRLGLFSSEWLGFEMQYISASVSDSDDRTALNSLKYRPLDSEDTNETVSPDPETNPVSGVIDMNIVIAPIYGKVNFIDKLIVYSDIYFTAGISSVTTEQGKLNALSLSAGQRFYIYENFSFRVDFRDRIYTEQRNGKDSQKHSIGFDIGASYFIW